MEQPRTSRGSVAPAYSARFPTIGSVLLFLASSVGEDILFPDAEERQAFFSSLRRLAREEDIEETRLVQSKGMLFARVEGLASDGRSAELIRHTLNELYAFYINMVRAVAIPYLMEGGRIVWVLGAEALHIAAEEWLIHVRRGGTDRTPPMRNPLLFVCSRETKALGPFPPLLDWLQELTGCQTRGALARYVTTELGNKEAYANPEALQARFRSWEDKWAVPERQTLDDLCQIGWAQDEHRRPTPRLRERLYLARFVQSCLGSVREAWGAEATVTLANSFIKAVDKIGERQAAEDPRRDPQIRKPAGDRLSERARRLSRPAQRSRAVRRGGQRPLHRA